jgi:aspartyl/asparaginyl beta-hydroxylase (cupin superfamily)
MSDINALIQQAVIAQRMGDRAGAERIYNDILMRAPNNPVALSALGRLALEARDTSRALDLLQKAQKANPNDPFVPLNISYIMAASGNVRGEVQALDQALAADPYCYPAMFRKGQLMAQAGLRSDAHFVLRNALKISGPDERLSSDVRALKAYARDFVDKYTKEKTEFLLANTKDIRERDPRTWDFGFEEAVQVAGGNYRVFHHEPTGFHFPGLPATCFFDRSRFDWLPALEAMTETICQELGALEAAFANGYEAYVQREVGQPLDQWAELNKSHRWSAMYLWRDGHRIGKVCDAAPKTAAFLDSLPKCDVPGLAPTAFFSALEPHTRIPPHTGVTNIRSIVHLPLVVPQNAWFRVGNDKRAFEKGKAWVFDDSIDHEAANDSAERRVILIFDVWNPNLSPAQRDLARTLETATSEFAARNAGPKAGS